MNKALHSRTARKPLALGIAAAIALGGAFVPGASAPAAAAPLSINQLAVKEAAPDNTIEVRRRSRRGGAVVAGLALGIIGAAIAAQAYDRHHRRYYRAYHPHGYYYGPPACIRKYGRVYCR